mgnify:CR=1 FL=1
MEYLAYHTFGFIVGLEKRVATTKSVPSAFTFSKSGIPAFPILSTSLYLSGIFVEEFGTPTKSISNASKNLERIAESVIIFLGV